MEAQMKQKLKEISKLREQKGKEDETLSLINKTKVEAKALSDWDTLAQLYWEESLLQQHLAMGEISKDVPDESLTEKSINNMGKAALKAHEIITEHKLDDRLGTSHRFLGRVADYKKNFKVAENEYRKAIELFEASETDAKGALEVKGFLACSMIMNGKSDKGIQLALDTFDAYETDPSGLALKESDYFVWAVWRSGIIPRVVKTLTSTDAEFDKEPITKYLEKTGHILKNPDNIEKWGNANFKFRLDEIENTQSLLDSSS